MTDEELAQALWLSQQRLCGYDLMVWTWEAPGGVVHLLGYSIGAFQYFLRCTGNSLEDDARVPYNTKLPNCLWCLNRMLR